MTAFNKVIVSCDDAFEPFRHIVQKAWGTFFPEVIVDICYVSVNKIDEPNVYNYDPIDGVPIGNLGKVLRLYHAAQQRDTVCSIHDIDTIPLQRHYLHSLLPLRSQNHLCLIGAEIFHGILEGKAPMVPTTAEGFVFQKVLHANCSWSDFVNNNLSIKRYDSQENLLSPNFSDESLMRYYRMDSDVNVHHLRRDELRPLNPAVDWIDRTLRNFTFDTDKLFDGFYTECNMERPYNPSRLKIINGYLDYCLERKWRK